MKQFAKPKLMSSLIDARHIIKVLQMLCFVFNGSAETPNSSVSEFKSYCKRIIFVLPISKHFESLSGSSSAKKYLLQNSPLTFLIIKPKHKLMFYCSAL